MERKNIVVIAKTCMKLDLKIAKYIAAFEIVTISPTEII